MSNISDFPPLDYHRDHNSPYEKLRELKLFPVVEEFYKDGKVNMITYNKGFFGRKKVYEAVLEKVDVNINVQDDDADENYFGITIYKQGEVVYKSLYNLGVFKASVSSIRAFHLQESMSLMEMGILSGSDWERHRNERDFLKKFDNTLALLNVIFAGTRTCSV